MFWFCLAARPIKGRVSCEGKPVANVLITDGYDFVQTDRKGEYAIQAHDKARFISMITPAGFIAPTKGGGNFPLFYSALKENTARADFELLPWKASQEGYELSAIADPQPKTDTHFRRLKSEIIPVLKTHIAHRTANGFPQAALILGDIVWDAPNLMPEVKKLFGELGIPIYPVIGNHDHDRAVSDDDGAAHNYRKYFGPAYYAFDLGKTHYIVLDDIIYHGNKKYDEQIDSVQLAWALRYARLLPPGERVCIAMHAPVFRVRTNHLMESAEPLLEAFRNFELHFISGHTHINSNFDITEGVVEHNVAQICGNLWYDTMNPDGTPKGYQLFREDGTRFEWQYCQLDVPADRQMRSWLPGEIENHPNSLVTKIWNWDPYWTVVWYEDGNYRGAMQRITLPDPDYTARLDSLRNAGTKLARSQFPRPTNFYFKARPSPNARSVTVVATDRFGKCHTETLLLRPTRPGTE